MASSFFLFAMTVSAIRHLFVPAKGIDRQAISDIYSASIAELLAARKSSVNACAEADGHA